MTSDEANAAFMAATPVLHGGIEYAKINAIIYRLRQGAVVQSLELADRQTNSVVIAATERVETIK